MTHTMLLVGFGPYLQFETNPSGEIARRLNGKRIRGVRVVGVVLPSKHGATSTAIREAIAKEKPDMIIGTGVALKGHVSLERVAINNFYSKEKGSEIDEPIEKNGKMAYHSRLPLKKIRSALKKEGIPAEYSFFADTYLCNEAFYEIMKIAYDLNIRKAGFVHLPISHRQAIEMERQNTPSMDEKTIEKAVRNILSITILAHEPKSLHFK